MDRIKTKVGFGEHVREIEVNIQDGDAEPWGADAKLNVVGTDVVRVDAALKASGRAKYTYDVNPRDLLHAFILHAPYVGTIKSLDTAAAERMPGVRGVHRFRKAGDPIVFHGQEIVALAADTAEQAEDALKAVEVEYESRPAVTTISEAMKEGAPRVMPRDENVIAGRRNGSGAEEAIANADKVVEATYETQVQTHSSLEPHGAVAKFNEDGSLTLWCSTQATFGTRDQAANVAGTRNVRVLAEFVGGGFGSKFGPSVAGLAAIRLAKQTGKPVKCMLTREGEHLCGGNRPSSIQKMKAGIAKDGTFTGLQVDVLGSSGFPGGGSGAANPMIYRFGRTEKSETGVRTNGGAAAAFRAPGHPQGSFALDSFMDECAHAVGLDPLEFRRRNCPDDLYRAQWELGAKMIGWDRRQKRPGSASGHLKRGIGMASTRWGNIGAPGSRVDVLLRKEGVIEVHNGAQDIGTGTKTLLAAIVAEELGVPPAQLVVKMGDTELPPGPASGGSTTAPSVGPAARNAGVAAREALAAAAAGKLGAKAEAIKFAGGKLSAGGKSMSVEEACALLPEENVRVTGSRERNYETYRGGVAGCQFAEVEVDVETGHVRPIKIVAIQDAGRVISKLTFESQVLGGVIQGISYALYEDRLLDPKAGTQVNADFLNYKIAGAADMPEIVPVAFSVANAGNNCGMAGLGEPPTIPTAAAIANAVFNATGARVRTLPITPARMLAALPKKDW